MEEFKKVKYIHLIWHNELKFNTRLVEMFADSANGFCSSEHLFVTPHVQVYEALKNHENVIFDSTFGTKKSAAYINRYAPKCDWLFVHFMCSPWEFLKVKRAYLHKIVHRTWGGDLSYKQILKKSIKKFANPFINKLFARRMRHIRLIGIANTVDALNVKEKIGDVPTHIMPYPVRDGDQLLSGALPSRRADDGNLNIMVGHSGLPYNNHKAILDALYRFHEEKIQIYVMVSYGRPEYIDEIKTYGKRLYGEKITFMDEMLPYNEYVKLLNNMDVAFLDAKISYALGNISVLTFLGKKIFLNRDGILRRAFDLDGLPYMCTSDLETVSFEEFSRPLDYSDELRAKLAPAPYEKKIQTWHEILNLLDHKI